MDNLHIKEAFKFIELVNSIKHSPRKEWSACKIKNYESVGSHTYAMAMMTFLIDEKSGLDRIKCMQLALVHDLAESIVDIKPHDNAPEEQLEIKAMKDLSKLIGKEQGDKLVDLYIEYADRITNEAKFVKDLDMFDTIFSANSYEERENKPGKLQEFFIRTKGKFKHPFVRKLVEELLQKRKYKEAALEVYKTCIKTQNKK